MVHPCRYHSHCFACMVFNSIASIELRNCCNIFNFISVNIRIKNHVNNFEVQVKWGGGPWGTNDQSF